MKALSIRPEYTMDIFKGCKTTEERTWLTDYRGDLLICASSHKEPGFVCGYAYMVVPLLDIRVSDEKLETDEGKYVNLYYWMLGKPKLIEPIAVKGKLHLFDVDDGMIRYVDGGDLAVHAKKEDADAFRTKYVNQYLDKLIYRPMKRSIPRLPHSESATLSPMDKIQMKESENISCKAMVEKIAFLNPNTPLMVELRREYDESSSAECDSQKAFIFGVFKKGASKADALARTTYNRITNLFALVWMTEAFGERDTDKLRNALLTALNFNGNASQKSVIFRHEYPFERIQDLINTPGGWRIDPALAKLINYRKIRREPFIAIGCKTDFYQVLQNEGIDIDDMK